MTIEPSTRPHQIHQISLVMEFVSVENLEEVPPNDLENNPLQDPFTLFSTNSSMQMVHKILNYL